MNWNRLCNLTIGKDPTTYDLAKDILKEDEHESWFLRLYLKDHLDICEENIPVNDLIHRNILDH